MSVDEGPSSPSMVIELFKGSEKYRTLKEKFESLQKVSARRGVEALILQLSEDVYNIFDNPYPFITIRKVYPEEEILSESRQGEESQIHDYFVVLGDIQRDEEHRVPESGYVFLGYKIVSGSDHECGDLDKNWSDWSGTKDIVKGLSQVGCDVQRLTCFKAFRKGAREDLFKYSILIRITSEYPLHVLDFLQKFRVRKMSGYLAYYTLWSKTDSDEMV